VRRSIWLVKRLNETEGDNQGLFNNGLTGSGHREKKEILITIKGEDGRFGGCIRMGARLNVSELDKKGRIFFCLLFVVRY